MADLRVLPRNYLDRYRVVSNILYQLNEEAKKEAERTIDDRMTFVLNISCGELTDQANDIISGAVEHHLPFQVGKRTNLQVQRQDHGIV